MLDDSERTKWLADFQTLDKLKDFLLSHGILFRPQELDEMWDRQVEQGRIYKLVVYGKKNRRKHVRFARIQPTCNDCGRKLPFIAQPVVPWKPGHRSIFLCDDCATKELDGD